MFAYFEKVKVASSPCHPNYVGREGVVLGIGEDEGNGYSYAASFSGEDICLSFWEKDLIGTGVILRKEGFYDGDSVKVRVNEEDEGHVVGWDEV